jgi:ALIX V-shaped domain binding to HIV
MTNESDRLQTDLKKSEERLREANTALVQSRRSDSAWEEWERALQNLDPGHLKCLEIAENLDELRKFYNEVYTMLVRWTDEIWERKKQMESLEGYDMSLRVNIRDVGTMDMAWLKIPDGTPKSPTPKTPSPTTKERGVSQRTTRATSRQFKEPEKPENTSDGNTSPGMWTPGNPTPK